MIPSSRLSLAQRKWQDIDMPLTTITELLVQLMSEDEDGARAALLSQIEAHTDELQEAFMSLDFEDVDELNASHGENFSTVEAAEEYLYSVCELIQTLRTPDSSPSVAPSRSIDYFLHSSGIRPAGIATGLSRLN